MQDGVTYPSTLDASRLKIIFRSVDSVSESTSEIKKLRLHFLRKCNRNLRKSGRKNWDYLRKFHFLRNISEKKCILPWCWGIRVCGWFFYWQGGWSWCLWARYQVPNIPGNTRWETEQTEHPGNFHIWYHILDHL